MNTLSTTTLSIPSMDPVATRMRQLRQLRRRRGSRGMTLIEILVVLAIIGLIVGGVSVVAFNAFGDAKIKSGGNDVINVQKACEQYMLQKNDKCPKSMADLKAAGVVSRVQKDPWGEEFVIVCPGEHGPVDVLSYGPDKKQGGGDDIVSWEAPKEKEDKKDTK